MEQQTKEAESFKPLTASTPSSTALTTARPEKDQAEIKAYAAKKARLLFGCYRKGDANDPDTYVAAITAVLSRYPEDVIRMVTHPAKGLPIRTQFLPTVKEVFDACEEQAQPKREAEARRKRIEKQISERDDPSERSVYPRDSAEAKAVRALHELVGRTSAFFMIFRKGDGSVTYTKRITPQLAAFAEMPNETCWQPLNRQQAYAWEELLRQVFDKGLIRTYLAEGSPAPWPWPPSIDGKIYEWGGAAPTMTDQDHEQLANEGR